LAAEDGAIERLSKLPKGQNMNTETQLHDSSDRLINEGEAAKCLGYTVRALQNWRVRGGGPKFIKVSSRSIRYRIRDLITWIEDRTVSSTSDQSAA
jgi:predicted DNA-binding transcriptional regulator AlpA